MRFDGPGVSHHGHMLVTIEGRPDFDMSSKGMPLHRSRQCQIGLGRRGRGDEEGVDAVAVGLDEDAGGVA